MRKIRLDYTNSSVAILGLLLISFVAFWPTYYAIFFESQFYIHFHVTFALLWFALLIIQPYLIKSRRIELHRLVGNYSYIIAPFVVISILLLAHKRIKFATESLFLFQSYLLYLQISLAFLFAAIYGFAIYFRDTMALHARLMVATSFTFIDPIGARLINTFSPQLASYGQWITYGFISLILLVLSYFDRNNHKAKWVFPSILVAFLISGIPLFFGFTEYDWWQTFAKWFASI